VGGGTGVGSGLDAGSCVGLGAGSTVGSGNGAVDTTGDGRSLIGGSVSVVEAAQAVATNAAIIKARPRRMSIPPAGSCA
jgi:hypothetical protein